jgi:hypothetical protein
MDVYICRKCKKRIDDHNAYEYRGTISCADCFDNVIDDRDFERQEIIKEESRKTEIFRGLDLDPHSVVGRANREILKPHIEITSKESGRLKTYESGKLIK